MFMEVNRRNCVPISEVNRRCCDPIYEVDLRKSANDIYGESLELSLCLWVGVNHRDCVYEIKNG